MICCCIVRTGHTVACGHSYVANGVSSEAWLPSETPFLLPVCVFAYS